MKELSSVKKIKVIQFFLTGQTYDEIALEAGISKGSVVNIVNEFREGILPIPTGMVEFVDELRKLVVDLKKHDTTVIHLKGYMKLHAKLKEMGVTSEQVGVIGVGRLGRVGGGGFVGGLGRVYGEDCVVSDVVVEGAGVWVSCDAADREVS